ncbi:hypothetical protein J6590_042160 [Homalodisca vitripennis]|nr:hypothetical protein J6590_042160 [Homalodisca vitripennis]
MPTIGRFCVSRTVGKAGSFLKWVIQSRAQMCLCLRGNVSYLRWPARGATGRSGGGLFGPSRVVHGRTVLLSSQVIMCLLAFVPWAQRPPPL